MQLLGVSVICARAAPPASRAWNVCSLPINLTGPGDTKMPQTKRGRSQDRRRVAGGQDWEVRYEVKKTGRSKGAVKRAVKKAGPSRRKVERARRS